MSGLAELVQELAEPIGGVSVKRMFGGLGIFHEGRMAALIAADTLYIKVDAETAPQFEAEGLDAFGYDTKDGRRVVMSYRRAPERVFDDPDEFRKWFGLGMAAAHRTGVKATRPPKSRRKPTA